MEREFDGYDATENLPKQETTKYYVVDDCLPFFDNSSYLGNIYTIA